MSRRPKNWAIIRNRLALITAGRQNEQAIVKTIKCLPGIDMDRIHKTRERK